MIISFKDLPVLPAIQQTLSLLGFTEPTEIQSKAIPLLLESKKVDFHGQAQTGTGKTLAFGLPLLHRIDITNRAPQALIVAPTRELALQISESLLPFARALNLKIETICGGLPMDAQLRALSRGAHVVVGTPGRLNDHLRRGSLNLKKVATLVLDEADIMLDMGFREEIDEILNFVPQNREIWLFSATVKSGISNLMSEHMNDPLSVRVSKKNTSTPAVKQYYTIIPSKSRFVALCRFIETTPDFYAFIFCQTKILAAEVAEKLLIKGYCAAALHGDMSQTQRNLVVKKFKEQRIKVLVATDVAARGIDIANLSHVINYSLPEDHESYVHRIGRTGRAGKEGISITFINKNETRDLNFIQQKFNLKIDMIEVPTRQKLMEARLEQARDYLVATQAKGISLDNHEVIKQLVTSLELTALQEIVGHFIQEKFFASLDQEDIQQTKVEQGDIQELSLSVGTDEGILQSDVASYLMATGLVTEADIKKIRIIKRKTFIEIPTHCASTLMTALRNTSLGGRKTNIQKVYEQDEHYSGGGNNRRREDRPFRMRRRR
ncbi:MAG: DEAD/DEAH box helicase [Candidatus Babeliaceae bacterium]